MPDLALASKLPIGGTTIVLMTIHDLPTWRGSIVLHCLPLGLHELLTPVQFYHVYFLSEIRLSFRLSWLSWGPVVCLVLECCHHRGMTKTMQRDSACYSRVSHKRPTDQTHSIQSLPDAYCASCRHPTGTCHCNPCDCAYKRSLCQRKAANLGQGGHCPRNFGQCPVS